LIHYPVSAHLSGAYEDAGWKRGSFPIAEGAADTVLSLPIGPHLKLDDARLVVEAVKDAVKSL